MLDYVLFEAIVRWCRNYMLSKPIPSSACSGEKLILVDIFTCKWDLNVLSVVSSNTSRRRNFDILFFRDPNQSILNFIHHR